MAIDTLGAALRQLNRLFANGVVAGLSDAQLLERFLKQGDAGAFDALVGRHGRMVLSVCRGILREPHDAEDAFQATFLVLVQKGSTIRGRGALAGWLHRVAHRVAIQANTAAARRRTLERRVGQLAVATSTNELAASDHLLRALHEEIARLPEKLRLAVVHCDLEGMTQAQAAAQLHWSERTIHSRLAEGRARLKRRLARRGLETDGAILGTVLLREARAAIPAGWSEATVRAALATLNPTMAVGVVSATANKCWDDRNHAISLPESREARLELGVPISGVVQDEDGKPIAQATVTAMAPATEGEEPRYGYEVGTTKTDEQGRWRIDDAPANVSDMRLHVDHPDYRRRPDQSEGGRERQTILSKGATVKGRVVDGSGKPVKGAQVDTGPAWLQGQRKPVVTDELGEYTLRNCEAGPWIVTAQAEGFAPGCQEVTVPNRGEVEAPVIQLGKASTLRVRVVDRAGKPVAGALVAVDKWRGHRMSLRFSAQTDATGRST
ncbi:MAG: sigma-70 family RNA polymerase sigma factor [Isosphaeraceae bacterium]